MMYLLTELGADRYHPFAYCLSNDSLIMVLYVAGNLITGVAYLAIGALFCTKRLRPLLIQPVTRGLLGSLLILTGVRRFSGTLLIFVGVYRLDLAILAALAAVSAATVLLTARELIEQSK